MKRLNITPDDAAAIRAALQLVPLAYSPDPEAILRNQLNSATVIQKLTSCHHDFIPNEIRVIFLAVGLAREYLAGRSGSLLDPAQVSDSLHADLSKFFFVYNRLYPQFAQLCSAM